MYSHLFVAGTFDGLHAGHRRLLTEAFLEGERVTIGLTSDGFIARFKSQIQKKIKSYKARKRNVEAWLRKQRLLDRAAIIPISDPYEPAASMPDLDVIIVTRENRNTGERINALRQGLALSSLTLIDVPMVNAGDKKPISSTRIRNGEIDVDGRIIMPESMRAILGEPLGDVLTGDTIARATGQNSGKIIITVGDVATKTFLDAGITPTLAIIDGKVGRKPFHETLSILQLQKVKPFRFKAVKSGPGFISKESMKEIQKVFIHSPIHPFTHHALVIDGEEDLLVLPVIQYAPLGSILYYGQPNEGLVEVMVTDEKKKQVGGFVAKFLS